MQGMQGMQVHLQLWAKLACGYEYSVRVGRENSSMAPTTRPKMRLQSVCSGYPAPGKREPRVLKRGVVLKFGEGHGPPAQLGEIPSICKQK